MSGFASEEYNSCKTWIAAQIQAGATWEQVKNLCVSPEFIDRELERLKYDELIIPLKMDLNMWRDLVKDIEGSYSPIVEMYGISADGNSNTLPIPTDSGSAWVRYKNAGFLIPIVTKGRGAKYKAGVTRGTKINIEE